jgi:hypothetical protein
MDFRRPAFDLDLRGLVIPLSRALPCGAGSACLIGIGAAILRDLDYDRATILAGYCSGSTLPAKAANALAKRRIYRADNR